MFVLTVALAVSDVAYAQNLTGIVQFATDSAGDLTGEAWNTLGSIDGGMYNIYVSQDAPPPPFINSGDGAAAVINLPLTPGVHTYTLHGEPGGAVHSFAALNLFFDGNNATPGISVFGAVNTTGGSPNGRPNTISLAGQLVPGANTLSTTSSGTTITLSDFRFNSATTTNLVSPFNDAPGGGNDYVATFTLTVAGPVPAPVPAPIPVPTIPHAAIPLVILMVGVVAWAFRRKLGLTV